MEAQTKTPSTHYLKYKDSTKRRALEYYYAHKEACIEANRKYQVANRAKILEQQRNRRQKKKVEAAAATTQ